jgi:integrase
MPRKVKELTAVEVARLRHGTITGTQGKAGGLIGAPCAEYHAVGDPAGLILQCRPPVSEKVIGSRSWVLRTKVGAKRKEFGLGGYPDVSLAEARFKAKTLKGDIANGIDPAAEKKAKRSALIREQAKVVTFESLAAEYVSKKAKEFKTTKQVQKLQNQLAYYAFPHIGKMVVADIERIHIENMVKAIWETKTETANRLRLHVEKILDLAEVKKLRTGENPARWSGNLELSFPARGKVSKVTHYAALPVNELPDFMAKIREQDWMGAKALEFLIMTAARSGEVRGATWSEIDFKAKTWTVPADRMKAGRAHKVPLTDAVILFLEQIPRLSEYLFTGSRGAMLTDATISKVPKRIGYEVTAHGFRSTFKDWCRLHTAYPDEVSELALAHVSSDSTRAAYARDELLDKRRLLMREWAQFCCHGISDKSGKVVAIRSGGQPS